MNLKCRVQSKRSALHRLSIVVAEQRLCATRPIERVNAIANQPVKR